jgi:quinol monooxygenase YgiN
MVKNERRAHTIYVLTHVDSLRRMRTIAFRANHFTVVEEWTNEGALDADAAAPNTRAFRKRLLPMEGALYDGRFYEKLD